MGNLIYYHLTFNYQLASDIQRRPLLKQGWEKLLPSTFLLGPSGYALSFGQGSGSAGGWGWYMDVSFFCSCVILSMGPSGVSLSQRGHLHRPQSLQGCPCSSVESLPWRVHLQPCPQQLSPSSCLPVPFLALSHVSSCAFFCICCHWQLLPFSNKVEWRHHALI